MQCTRLGSGVLDTMNASSSMSSSSPLVNTLRRVQALVRAGKSSDAVANEIVLDRDGQLRQLFIGLLAIIVVLGVSVAALAVVLAVARTLRPRLRIALVVVALLTIACAIALTAYIRAGLYAQVRTLMALFARWIDRARAGAPTSRA